MNTKKILALLLAVGMIAGLMAGCANSGTSTSGKATGASCDIAVNLASEPQTIDPALNSSVDGAIMLNHFFEGLLKYVDNGQAVTDKTDGAELAPGMAEKWDKTVNDDGTVTYTFHLREDAKWSDGQALTANDFVYSWQRLADPKTAADYTYMIDMVKGYDEVANGVGTGKMETVTDKDGKTSQQEVMNYADPSTLGVSATDDHTFVVVLSYDCPYFEQVCAFPATYPVRKDVIEANGDQWTFDPATYVTNGAYKMSEWTHNSAIKAVKNDNYYDAKNITCNSITFQLEGQPVAQDVVSQITGLPGLGNGFAHVVNGARILGADVDIALAGTDRQGGQRHAFDQRIGVAFQQHAVGERT